MITIYGIKNCDTMQKAFKWLDAQHIHYQFHNYKTDGLEHDKVEEWLNHFASDILINTKGTTFKNLSVEEKSSLKNKSKAINLILQNPSMIKRPLVEMEDGYLIGFKPEEWTTQLL